MCCEIYAKFTRNQCAPRLLALPSRRSRWPPLLANSGEVAHQAWHGHVRLLRPGWSRSRWAAGCSPFERGGRRQRGGFGRTTRLPGHSELVSCIDRGAAARVIVEDSDGLRDEDTGAAMAQHLSTLNEAAEPMALMDGRGIGKTMSTPPPLAGTE